MLPRAQLTVQEAIRSPADQLEAEETLPYFRVRMKQIGVRDEAGVIGGMGPCGRETCCCTWLKQFESINIRMAKVQRTSSISPPKNLSHSSNGSSTPKLF